MNIACWHRSSAPTIPNDPRRAAKVCHPMSLTRAEAYQLERAKLVATARAVSLLERAFRGETFAARL